MPCKMCRIVIEEYEIDGNMYYMNCDGYLWEMELDGSQGKWVGIYIDHIIDRYAPEPRISIDTIFL
jgi:hypothetical protein